MGISPGRMDRFVARVRRACELGHGGCASRLFWLKATIIPAFCIGLFVSPRLWIGPRAYPQAPVFSALPAIDGFVAHSLFAVLLVLAAAALISPKPQKLIAVFLAIVAVFCLFDQTRWQPWVFQYSFLLATLALFSWDGDDIDGQKHTLNIARLIIASTYVFSGLQKINLNFMENDFPWLVQPITNLLPSTSKPFYYFGMAVPFIQVAFGAGLLTKRYRHVALIAAVSMHVFILAMFGHLASTGTTLSGHGPPPWHYSISCCSPAGQSSHFARSSG